MRAILASSVGKLVPDHIGLAYGRHAPFERGTGKVSPKARDAWLQSIADTSCPTDYAQAYERWRKAMESDGSRTEVVELASRLLVGHGNPSPTEVGLTVHHTWGVPIVPGSALKGLTSHYIDAVYGPGESTTHPMDPALSEAAKERAAYRGVTWDKRARLPLYGPGEIHRELFGAPATKTDRLYAGSGERQGRVIFQDAWYVPSSAKDDMPFGVDVMTVHQKEYYNSRGRKSGPTDWDEPNPISFLTVKPGAKFLVAVSGPAGWAAFALGGLVEALAEWGVGGKTAAGYGRMFAANYVSLDERARLHAQEVAHVSSNAPENNISERAHDAEVTRMMRDLNMSNAAQLLPRIYERVPKAELAAMAKSAIDKLTRKSLRNKLDKPWVKELFKAAGEGEGANS